jgi:hypothetical protein
MSDTLFLFVMMGLFFWGLYRHIDGKFAALNRKLLMSEEEKQRERQIEQRMALQEKEWREKRRERWRRFGPAVIFLAACALLVWMFGAKAQPPAHYLPPVEYDYPYPGPVLIERGDRNFLDERCPPRQYPVGRCSAVLQNGCGQMGKNFVT